MTDKTAASAAAPEPQFVGMSPRNSCTSPTRQPAASRRFCFSGSIAGFGFSYFCLSNTVGFTLCQASARAPARGLFISPALLD